MIAEKDSSTEATLKKKYGNNYVVSVKGITKPIAEKIAHFAFGDKLINLTANKGNRQYDVFVKDSVNEKTFSHFNGFWKGIFNAYKSGK